MTDLKSLTEDFVAGYTLGFESGQDIGYRQGVDDESAAWTSVFTGCAETWRQPRFGEIMLARKVTHDPCRSECGRCAQCVHAESWHRRGGRPYMGVERERQRHDRDAGQTTENSGAVTG